MLKSLWYVNKPLGVKRLILFREVSSACCETATQHTNTRNILVTSRASVLKTAGTYSSRLISVTFIVCRVTLGWKLPYKDLQSGCSKLGVFQEHTLTKKCNITWHFVASTRRLKIRSGNMDSNDRLFIPRKPKICLKFHRHCPFVLFMRLV